MCAIMRDLEATVGAAKLDVKVDERLALRLGSAEVDLLFGRTVLKKDCFADTGEVTGVVDAMVLPIPAVRRVGESTLRFLVMEHGEGDNVAVGTMSAGLCGEPIAMTKGMLVLDAVLGLREGAAALELVDASRGRNCKGLGTADAVVELLECFSGSVYGSGEARAGVARALRAIGHRAAFAWTEESRIASTMMFVRGGVCILRGDT